jgi:ATP-dependent protease HslVU (ClpYQ) peptidase subunit
MTCIVGLKGPDGIYIGGDSAVSSHNLVQTICDPKVWRKGQFILGFAGTLRAGQIIKYNLKIPPINQREPTQYMVTSFVNAMRKSLKDAGAAREEHKEEEHDNQFLVGWRGRLFEIDEAYGVCEVADEFVAIGSGTEYALGSLHTTRTDFAEERVKKALEAAAYFSESVRAPFHIVKIKNKK